MDKIIINAPGSEAGTGHLSNNENTETVILKQSDCFNLVRIACSEYLTNPTVCTIQRGCILDKSILITFYKYLITISDGSMKFLTGYDLYMRLGDLMKLVQMKQKKSIGTGTSSNSGNSSNSIGIGAACISKSIPISTPASTHMSTINNITLLFPPWNMFKLAIQRLLTQGLLITHKPSSINTSSRSSSSNSGFIHSNHSMIAMSESYQHPLEMLQSLCININIDVNDIKTSLKNGPFASYL